ncbi:MAG: ATP synthase F1 subunit gamma [Planctomycetota bacterium]
MANVKELRGRIKSVKNIAQITKAMEMVASMKLRKVQARALASRPYTEEIRTLGQHLSDCVANDAELPLFRSRPVSTVGVFVVTSDRGLCGAYNANILSRLHRYLDEQKAAGRKVRLYVYGRKGYTYLYRRNFDVEKFFVEPPLDKMDFDGARMVVQKLVEDFESGVVDQVRLFYTSFLTVAKFAPTDVDFLPVPRSEFEDDVDHSLEYDYLLEPSAEALLDLLVPKYLETVVFDAMLQSLAAEHASRRMAMKGATDAASRMSVELQRIYNRARQESITKELLDIVGGATAVQSA